MKATILQARNFGVGITPLRIFRTELKRLSVGKIFHIHYRFQPFGDACGLKPEGDRDIDRKSIEFRLVLVLFRADANNVVSMYL